MKLKHRRLIEKSYLVYAHLSKECSSVPDLYYLMGIYAIRYKEEQHEVGLTKFYTTLPVYYFRFPGLFGFRVTKLSNNEITVKTVKQSGFTSQYYFKFY